MKINEAHPLFEDFIRNEVNTINKLQADSALYSSFPQFGSELSILSSKLKGLTNNGYNFNLPFNLKFDLLIEGNRRTVLFEGLLNKNFTLATYALTICNSDKEPYDILRKFHFDYDPTAIGNSNKKPIFHIQYGGKPTPLISALQINHEALNSWLSSPRLSSIPTNFVLLLDMMFCEFPCEQTHKIIQGKNWRELIKSNEEFLLKNYFLGINNFFTSSHKVSHLYRDFYYGETRT